MSPASVLSKTYLLFRWWWTVSKMDDAVRSIHVPFRVTCDDTKSNENYVSEMSSMKDKGNVCCEYFFEVQTQFRPAT